MILSKGRFVAGSVASAQAAGRVARDQRRLTGPPPAWRLQVVPGEGTGAREPKPLAHHCKRRCIPSVNAGFNNRYSWNYRRVRITASSKGAALRKATPLPLIPTVTHPRRAPLHAPPGQAGRE
jgi:hypothetical protein